MERLKSKSEESLTKTVSDVSKIFVAERKRKMEEHSTLKTKEFHRSLDSYLNDVAYYPYKREKFFGLPKGNYEEIKKSLNDLLNDTLKPIDDGLKHLGKTQVGNAELRNELLPLHYYGEEDDSDEEVHWDEEIEYVDEIQSEEEILFFESNDEKPDVEKNKGLIEHFFSIPKTNNDEIKKSLNDLLNDTLKPIHDGLKDLGNTQVSNAEMREELLPLHYYEEEDVSDEEIHCDEYGEKMQNVDEMQSEEEKQFVEDNDEKPDVEKNKDLIENFFGTPKGNHEEIKKSLNVILNDTLKPIHGSQDDLKYLGKTEVNNAEFCEELLALFNFGEEDKSDEEIHCDEKIEFDGKIQHVDEMQTEEEKQFVENNDEKSDVEKNKDLIENFFGTPKGNYEEIKKSLNVLLNDTLNPIYGSKDDLKYVGKTQVSNAEFPEELLALCNFGEEDKSDEEIHCDEKIEFYEKLEFDEKIECDENIQYIDEMQIEEEKQFVENNDEKPDVEKNKHLMPIHGSQDDLCNTQVSNAEFREELLAYNFGKEDKSDEEIHCDEKKEFDGKIQYVDEMQTVEEKQFVENSDEKPDVEKNKDLIENFFGIPKGNCEEIKKSLNEFLNDTLKPIHGIQDDLKYLGKTQVSNAEFRKELLALCNFGEEDQSDEEKHCDEKMEYDEIHGVEEKQFVENNDEKPDVEKNKDLITETKHIFDDFIESEKIYVNKLRSCDRFYRRCLKDEWITPALKRLNSKFNIFDDMKKIYNFHSRIMLPTLISAKKDVEIFKQILIENAEPMKAMYQSYIKNRVGADKIIDLHEDFFNMKSDEFGFIIKINTGELNFPVDRITRTYGGFIDNMKKNYEAVAKEPATEKEDFKNERYWNIMASIEEILNNINMDINLDSTPIKGLKRNISENRGKLIKCCNLHIKYGPNKTEVMKCYLHENYLIFAYIVPRTAKGLFEDLYLCTAMQTKSIYLRESTEKENKANKHYFEVREFEEKNKNKKIIFKKNSLEDHNAWKDAIRDLLADQLKKEKAKKHDLLSKTTGEIQLNGPLRSGEIIITSSNPMDNITMDEPSENDPSRRVKQCLTDLMNTEKEYTKYLELFLQYISKNEDPFFISDGFLKKTKRILMFHSKTMIPAMEKSLQNERWSVSTSGDVFMENESGFKLYNEFSPKTETSLDIVNNHKYVCRAVASQLGSNHYLYSFCSDPFNIIVSYYCAICDLIEITEDSDFDFRTIDKYKAAKESKEKLLHNIKEKLYVERIKDCQVEMINQGELVATDIFDVTLGNNEPQQMRCFLFEKMIILTVIRLEEKDGNYFHYHDAIDVRYLRYSLPKDPSATSFRVWHENKLFKLYNFIANDSETVKKWVESIITLLNIPVTKGFNETFMQSTDKPMLFSEKSRIRETIQQIADPPNIETIDNFFKQPEENISPSNQKDLIKREKYMDFMDDLIAEEEEFVRNLKSWIEGPQNLRIDEQIFIYTKYIYNFHSNDLLPALKNAEYNLADLAGVFIEHKSSFTHYEKKICVRNEYDNFVVVNQYSHFCKNIIKDVLNEDNPLCIFFEDPLRSITLYVKVIENLIHLPTEDSGKVLEKLTSAKNILEEVIKKFEFKTILEQIRYSKVDLLAQGRLITQGNFYVTDSKDQAFEMSCFLFEKMILFTVISVENCDKLFDYHDSISFDSLGKTDPKSNSPESFQVYFKKFNNPKRYTLTGNTTTVQEWVEIIGKVLNAHFQTAKESQVTLQRNRTK